MTCLYVTLIFNRINSTKRLSYISDKIFKNGPSEICGKQHLKNLKGYGLLKQYLHFSKNQNSIQTFRKPFLTQVIN